VNIMQTKQSEKEEKKKQGKETQIERRKQVRK